MSAVECFLIKFTFSFYKGDRTLSVLGHVNQFEMNIEGMISIYEAEKIAKYIK